MTAPARRTTDRIDYKWIVAAVFVCGMFIDILDTTIVNVALPDLGREFHATTASIEWIVLGYLLSLALWIPASGWIGDRLGTRRVFLFAIAVLPYSLQTFLRFKLYLPSFSLYVGDFSLILLSLAVLRVRSLQQRRDDPNLADRLRDWRRSLMQFGVAFLMAGLLLALHYHGGSFESAMSDYDLYVVGAFLLIILLTRSAVRRLPGFLSA